MCLSPALLTPLLLLSLSPRRPLLPPPRPKLFFYERPPQTPNQSRLRPPAPQHPNTPIPQYPKIKTIPSLIMRVMEDDDMFGLLLDDLQDAAPVLSILHAYNHSGFYCSLPLDATQPLQAVLKKVDGSEGAGGGNIEGAICIYVYGGLL